MKGFRAVADVKRLTLTTLLGVIAFISKSLLPHPIDKAFPIVQAVAFALASLVIGRWGATYASMVSGALLGIMRVGFFPFTLIFSITYGLLIDAFLSVFKVKAGSRLKASGLIGSLALSTAITGLIAIYVTTLIGLMPMMPILYFVIFVVGVLNGAAAGYLTSLFWNKYLAHYFKGRGALRA